MQISWLLTPPFLARRFYRAGTGTTGSPYRFANQHQRHPQVHWIAHVAIRPDNNELAWRIERRWRPFAGGAEAPHARQYQRGTKCNRHESQPAPRVVHWSDPSSANPNPSRQVPDLKQNEKRGEKQRADDAEDMRHCRNATSNASVLAGIVLHLPPTRWTPARADGTIRTMKHRDPNLYLTI